MFLHNRFVHLATALLVVVIGVALFALPATSLSTGSLGIPSGYPASRGESSTPSGLLFVENAGQWPDAARFQVWGSPAGVGTTWLAEDAIWMVFAGGTLHMAGSQAVPNRLLDLQPASIHYASLRDFVQPAALTALKLTFPGSNADVRIEPLDPLTTTISYFLGEDPVRWHPDVPVYGGVRFADLYSGVDLVLDGRDAFWHLEAAPGAETAPVRLQVEGADILAIDGVTMRLAAQKEPLEIALPKASFAYLASGVSPQGEALDLEVRPSIDASRQPAVPDDNPGDLIYGTFLGGSEWDDGHAIAVDAAGRATVTGVTGSSDFPTTPGAFDPSHNGGDAFVMRLNASGSALDYATFLGGNGADSGSALALDSEGCATVTGSTTSNDFPTTPNAFDTSYSGGDAFVVRLNANGSALDYATFLGGSAEDRGSALALDAAGRATVTGFTASSDFPTTPNAFDTSYNDNDVFVAQLDAAGSALDYATFLGGSSWEFGSGLALDAAGRASVTGYTYSTDFPTTPDAFDRSHNGGSLDAFVARLDATGSVLDYATFLGGSSVDWSFALALDAEGRATVTGETQSSDFPTTPGAPSGSLHPGDCFGSPCPDAFVAQLNSTGSGLTYATYLGSGGGDSGHAIAMDAAGRATVTGLTDSWGFPTTPGAFDPSYGGGRCPNGFLWPCLDAFVARLNPTGSGLAYATYLGGNLHDSGDAIAVDSAGRAVVTGWTWSDDFPTTPGAFDTSHNGSQWSDDPFVASLFLTLSAAAQWTTHPPIVDGDLSEWGQSLPLLLNRSTAFGAATQPPGSPPPTPADNSAELRALWTTTNLYFAIFVRDDWLVNDSQYVWQDDEIELAFVGAWMATRPAAIRTSTRSIPTAAPPTSATRPTRSRSRR